MRRYQVTQASSLKIGDRFYKQNDRAKKVLVMVSGDPKSTKYRTYKHWCLDAMTYDSDRLHQSYKNSQKTAIDGTTSVVFLRHETV